MGLKSFLFTDEGEGNQKKEDKKPSGTQHFKSKFPSSTKVEEPTKNPFKTSTFTPTSNVTVTPDNPACEPHLAKIMEMFENGFNNLNQDGYDFYEFYKAVIQVGVDNPSVYDMAFTMAKTMDSGVSKQSLLNQSEFYINEIDKVYKQYVSSGTQKRQETLQQKENEEGLLTLELNDINKEIIRLTALKGQKEEELSKIDGRYTPDLTEIDCKLMANDVAKDTILNSIRSVVMGIKQNLK